MPLVSISFDQQLLDQLEDSLKNAAPKRVLSATKSAVRSGAFFFRGALKFAVKKNTFGWTGLANYTPDGTSIGARVRSNPPAPPGSKVRKGKAPRQTQFLGKLSNVFRYSMAGDGLSAVVGILRESVGAKGYSYFGLFQSGQDKVVTPQMRNYFGAIGIPLKRNTTALHEPARPVVAPVWEQERGNIGKIMSAKLAEKLGGGK
jgi:hypothetical protein